MVQRRRELCKKRRKNWKKKSKTNTFLLHRPLFQNTLNNSSHTIE